MICRHCISEWGHNFRPSYLALGAAIQALGSPPVLALTATATPRVVADIKKQLDLPDMRVVNTGIYRANLCYEVLRVTNESLKKQHLVSHLRKFEGAGIVYCAMVKKVEALIEFLQGSEFAVRPYHGRLRATQKEENQDLFMNGELKAMIATNAFGMGIDKPDIRFVIHYQLPGSLEAYYQESGRAGRDGDTAHCILFYQLDDRRTQLFFMGKGYPKADDVLSVYETLKSLQAQREPVRLLTLQESTSGVGKTKVRVSLALLKQTNVVQEARYARFKLIEADLGRQEIDELFRQCEEKGRQDRDKLEQMMLYGQSAACRWKMLHDYFNELFPQEHCGHCDNCLQPLEQQVGVSAQPEDLPGGDVARP